MRSNRNKRRQRPVTSQRLLVRLGWTIGVSAGMLACGFFIYLKLSNNTATKASENQLQQYKLPVELKIDKKFIAEPDTNIARQGNYKVAKPLSQTPVVR